MKAKFALGAFLVLLTAVMLAACGAKEKEPAGTSDPLAAAGDADKPEPKSLVSADPEAIRSLLRDENLPNGDIYLDGSVVHVNIVGLTPEIAATFDERFEPGTFRLHDVRFTIQELEETQNALHEHELYRKLNLYSSGIDVINNRVTITMPDDAADKVDEIEKVADKERIVYDFVPLGEPHAVGVIAEVDAQAKRILVHEDGQEQPNIWFSFNEYSILTGEDGGKIKFDELKKARRVQVWSTGMIAESFPAQGTARKVVLLDEQTPKNDPTK